MVIENGTIREIRERIRNDVPEDIRDSIQALLRYLEQWEQEIKRVRNVIFELTDDTQKLILEIALEQLERGEGSE